MPNSRILVCAQGNRDKLLIMDDAMPIAPLMCAAHVSRGIKAFEHFKAIKEETSRLCYTKPTLIVVRYGRGTVFTDDHGHKKTHRFQPESIGLFPAGFEHLCSPTAGNDFFCLTLSERLLRDTANDVSSTGERWDWRPILGTQDGVLGQLTDALRRLIEERSESRLLFETLAQSILLRIAEVANAERHGGHCTSPHNNGRTRSTGRIERVAEALRSDPARNVGLEEMAKLASLSPTYFSRTFKSFTGISPSEFQTRERIVLAERLMQTDDSPLSKIAVAVGFHSVQGLRRAYQRVKGKPMRRWANAPPDSKHIDH